MNANSAEAHGVRPCEGKAQVSIVIHARRTELPLGACYETYQDIAPANEP